ncbi:AsmA family protein [Rhizobium sp. RU33A]|uniref:AsmA family protein n=1 Tax=Rhizobium sp. RU33A TaxID=1907413 RepID=UPI0009560476|nr:AsmA-like C-terminal region-containing protein [Rhizobium sp. RU33A]SIR07381.1 AsmA family protein [Rhizobium sp. RU33A]
MLGRILVTFGGLLVVALFAALLAPLFVDWTNFRRDFEDQASQLLGKKVVVNGEVSARLLPFPSVTMEDVTVGTDVDGTPLVRIARFSLDAELAPFLSGEARIFDMRIEEPQARIRLLPDGTLDWLRGSRPSIPARTVVLEKVSVTGGRIEFIDEQSGRNRVLAELDAALSARTLAGPWSVQGRAVLDGEAAQFGLTTSEFSEIALPLRLRIEPERRPFDLMLEGELALEEGKPHYAGSFSSTWKVATPAEALEPGQTPLPAPRMRGEFKLANDSITVPSYRLELGDAVDPYVISGEAKLDTGANPEFLLTAEGQQVDVNRLAADGSRAKTSRNGSVSVQQRLALLLASAAEIPIPKVPGRATLRLPAIVAGDTVFRDLQLDVRPAGNGWAVDRAVGLLPGRTQVEASGRLTLVDTPSFEGNLLIASTQPSGLATWIAGRVDPSIRGLSSAGFSASVNLTPELQRFENLELAIGDDPLKGRIERESPIGQAASLSIDLAGAGLDLDAARAIAALVVGEDAEQRLLAERVATRLKVGALRAFGVTAEDVEAIATYEAGQLSIERFNLGSVAGSAIRVTGSLRDTLATPAGEAEIDFVSEDPGRFLALLAERLPASALIDRLARSAQWYPQADIKGKLQVTDAGAVTLGLTGRVDQTALALTAEADAISAFLAGGKRSVDIRLENEEAQVLLGQVGFDPLPWTTGEGGVLTLTVNAAGEGNADAVVTFVGPATTLEATAQLTALDTPGMLDGGWDVSLDSQDIGPYLMALGLNLPDAATGLPVKGETQLSLADDQLAIERMTGTIGGQTVEAQGQVNLTGSVPSIAGTVSLDELDLDWLAATMIGPLTDPVDGALSEAALGAASLPFDLDLGLTVKQFWPGAAEAMTDVSGTLRNNAGELSFDDIAGDWLGGKAKGRFSVANTDGNGFLQARLDLEGGDVLRTVNALRLGRGMTEAETPAGRMDVTLVAEGAGKTPAELIGTARGSGEARFNSLTFDRLHLDIMPALIAEVDALGTEISEDKVRDITERLVGDGRTELTGLVLPFALSDGTLRIQAASHQADAAKLDAALRLDLRAAVLDGEIGVALNAGEAAMEGGEPNFRLLFQGDALSPSQSLDVTELTNFVSLRAFETERRRVEALQASVLEKQRLRREAALARSRAEERARAEAERLRMEEEARLKAEADAAAEAAQEAEALAAQPEAPVATPVEPLTTDTVPVAPVLPVAPEERVIRQPLPDMRFEGLPGVD